MHETQLAFHFAEEIGQLWARIAQATQDVFATAIQIGEKLNQADNIPGFDFSALPFDDAQAKRFRNVYARRDELDQQTMFEILSLPAPRDKSGGFAGPELKWTKWAGPVTTLTQWTRKRLAEMPVEQWPPDQRTLLRGALKPLIEIYEQL